MLRRVDLLSVVLVLSSFAMLTISGCSEPGTKAPPTSPIDQTPDSKTTSDKSRAAGVDSEHAHKPGEHGGIIVEIGRDNYHAEAVFEKGGVLRLYTLGKDEAKIQEVEAQTLTGYVKPEGGNESTALTFRPMPQSGDAEGKTSRFIANLPKDLAGKSLEVTIPSIRIGGERFRLGFKSAPAAHEEGLPDKVSGGEERQLYLTPGGKYTEADIKANGNMTASEKFKGLRSSHNARTKEGDKICPISETKANPQFLWIVGGKAYQFCCPPCVDEFVKLAKEQPEQIKEPEQYVKK